MLFDMKTFALYGLFAVAFASVIPAGGSANHGLTVRDGDWPLARMSPNLAVRSKKKNAQSAKCSARTFTKAEVGAAYSDRRRKNASKPKSKAPSLIQKGLETTSVVIKSPRNA